MTLSYSRSLLVALRPVITNTIIAQPLWSTLQRLSVCRSVSRTRRGTKAGRRVIRTIPTVVRGCDVNVNNLQQLIVTNGMASSRTCDHDITLPSGVSAIKNIVHARHENAVRKQNTVDYANTGTIKPVKEDLASPDPLILYSLNCRCVKNKALSMGDLVTTHDVDILALTETWLGTVIDSHVLSELVPPGYDMLHVSCTNRRGRGVALLFKEGMSVKRMFPTRTMVTPILNTWTVL